MTLSLLVYVIATKILFVASAPKLRYVLFDPLTYDAKNGPFSAKKDSSVKEAPTTNSPTDQDTANLIYFDSSGEFLENNGNSTEHIVNNTLSTTTVVETTQTTSKKVVETPASALRSKSCFSCTGSLRTGDSVSIPLKALPIYLRDNENQKGYPKFGYEFDEAVCKLVNNRILCGYNKNTGTIPNSKEIVHVDTECRIRGDRIECGYGNTGGGGGNGKTGGGGRNGNIDDVSGNGESGKRVFKLKLPIPLPDETATIFKLKDILSLHSTKTNKSEETKSATVKDDPEKVLTPEPYEAMINFTKAEPVSDAPTTTTASTTTTVTTKMTDTTMETNLKTAKTETETQASSKMAFLSLRSIMKMNEDLEKMSRQGSQSETTEYVPSVTRCVEIGDRIVCYNYKPKPTTAVAATFSNPSTPAQVPR